MLTLCSPASLICLTVHCITGGKVGGWNRHTCKHLQGLTIYTYGSSLVLRPNQTLLQAVLSQSKAFYAWSAWRRWEVVIADTAEMDGWVCINPSRAAACQNSQTSSSGTNNHFTFIVTNIAFLPSSFANRHKVMLIICRFFNFFLVAMIGKFGKDISIKLLYVQMISHENSHKVDQPQHAHSSEVRLGVFSLESNVPPLLGDPGLQLDGRH